ncbi:MAG: hypothetical protein OHK0017_06690 [Patescibacteria group bacterium]
MTGLPRMPNGFSEKGQSQEVVSLEDFDPIIQFINEVDVQLDLLTENYINPSLQSGQNFSEVELLRNSNIILLSKLFFRKYFPLVFRNQIEVNYGISPVEAIQNCIQIFAQTEHEPVNDYLNLLLTPKYRNYLNRMFFLSMYGVNQIHILSLYYPIKNTYAILARSKEKEYQSWYMVELGKILLASASTKDFVEKLEKWTNSLEVETTPNNLPKDLSIISESVKDYAMKQFVRDATDTVLFLFETASEEVLKGINFPASFYQLNLL